MFLIVLVGMFSYAALRNSSFHFIHPSWTFTSDSITEHKSSASSAARLKVPSFVVKNSTFKFGSCLGECFQIENNCGVVNY